MSIAWPPRAWPCEYCGETHGSLVVCVPRAETIFALMVGVGFAPSGSARLVCQYVVEPEPTPTGTSIYVYNVEYVDNAAQREGTYAAIDRSAFAQFRPLPPAAALGVLTIEDMQKWADEQWPAPQPEVRVVPAMTYPVEIARNDEAPERVVIPTRKIYARVRIPADVIYGSSLPPKKPP